MVASAGEGGDSGHRTGALAIKSGIALQRISGAADWGCTTPGSPMKQYEIRVFDDKGKTSLVFHRTHSDDQVAIEDAIELAGDRAFDLWRGMDCLFALNLAVGQTLQ